ncbi:hypothetical protein BJX68DRAFT_266282 [Aspergillus pseudodeflectus]|uniref:Uncharacterized protein n=1 Tax=Aspergillus pseudodeflectus TaxID=176178 RepID=A0ABR4KGG5_9EURO
MSLSLPAGLLKELHDDGERVLIVPMGGVEFVAFNTKPAIGTIGLNSCSVVIIASQHGAILAHIPPRLNLTSDDLHEGDRNVRRMMGLVKAEHDRYKPLGWFPDNETVIVCAWFQGALALEDQVQIMYESLQELGCKPMFQTYEVPVDQSRRGQGTVLVTSLTRMANGKPTIYIQDRPMQA